MTFKCKKLPSERVCCMAACVAPAAVAAAEPSFAVQLLGWEGLDQLSRRLGLRGQLTFNLQCFATLK